MFVCLRLCVWMKLNLLQVWVRSDERKNKPNPCRVLLPFSQINFNRKIYKAAARCFSTREYTRANQARGEEREAAKPPRVIIISEFDRGERRKRSGHTELIDWGRREGSSRAGKRKRRHERSVWGRYPWAWGEEEQQVSHVALLVLHRQYSGPPESL